jgi:fucose 4-O-acetylase-like acetyltransferase
MRSTELSWEDQATADPGRLWAGGAVTAVVAAGVALVAVLVCDRLLHTTLLNPDGTKEAADDAMVMLPLLAAIVTVFATGLLHLLMATTPQAPQFFAWIGALAMALVLLEVFLSTTGEATGRIATGSVYLLLGVVIISSLAGVGRTAVRYHRRQVYRDDPYRGGDSYRGGESPRYDDGYHGPRRYR